MGTVSYMSPEQARGQLADARTDLFSLGTVLYQMATSTLPFPGETSAVVFDAILNRDPLPAAQLNPALPPDLGRILDKALEKDRNLRYQTATVLKTDLTRLKRDMDSGKKRAAEKTDSRGGGTRQAEKSIAVLFFENLSGVKEDEYFRDGITEDIITELSKIKGLSIFSRPTVLAYRDKQVTPAQIGQQLNAAYVLAGSLRRKRDAEGFGDLARDLVLYLEDVLHLAVVPLRPERKVRVRVDELRVDPQPVAGPPQAPREDVSRVELLPDLRGRHLLVAIGEDRRPREDAQALDLRKLRDDVLGDPVPEILVLLHAGEVLEEEDGDGLLGLPGSAPARVGLLGRALLARVHVALQAREIGLQVCCCLVAQVTVLLERFVEDAPEVGWKRGIQLCGRERIPVQDRVEDDRGRLAREGQRARRHLVKDRPEREEVRAGVGELPARLLGGHVRHRAHRRAGRREVVLSSDGLEEGDGPVSPPARSLDAGEAEVQDLHLPARVHEDVRRLDVAVHDATGMCRLEGVGDLDAHGEQGLQVEWRTPRHHLCERLAFEELHDDEVLPLVLLDGVNRADSGMVQGRGGTRLALEALERRSVLGKLGGQELDCDAAAEA